MNILFYYSKGTSDHIIEPKEDMLALAWLSGGRKG